MTSSALFGPRVWKTAGSRIRYKSNEIMYLHNIYGTHFQTRLCSCIVSMQCYRHFLLAGKSLRFIFKFNFPLKETMCLNNKGRVLM